ncbi:hypothetical protein [Enterococcus malodoratus]|uniref:hypothetical protein n=1 Tax=Enterococcus malodoratus TaxID=71451 RepID=UPI0039B03199
MGNGTFFVKRNLMKLFANTLILGIVYWYFVLRITETNVSEYLWSIFEFSLVLLIYIVTLFRGRLRLTEKFYKELYLNSYYADDGGLRINLSIGEINIDKDSVDYFILDQFKNGFVIKIPFFSWVFGVNKDSREMKYKKLYSKTFKKYSNKKMLNVADAIMQLDSKSKRRMLVPSILVVAQDIMLVVIRILYDGDMTLTPFELIKPYIFSILIVIPLGFILFSALLRQEVDYKVGLGLPDVMDDFFVYNIPHCQVKLNKADVTLEYDFDTEILTTTIRDFKYIRYVAREQYKYFIK